MRRTLERTPTAARVEQVTAALRRPARWCLPALLPLAALTVIAWSFWPGHMSTDTLVQIEEVRSGEFTDHHAPILLALWQPFYDAGFGPGWVLGLQLLTFAAGLWLLLRSVLGRLGAALGTAIICLSPPVFGMLGYISRDVWFTALLLLTAGAGVRAAGTSRGRIAWLVVAIAAAWLTLAARQNAPTVVVVLLAAVSFELLGGLRGRRRVAAALGAGVVATLALMVSQMLVREALDVREVNPAAYTMIYDLAAISRATGRDQFPPEIRPEGGLAGIERAWEPDTVRPLVFGPDAPITTALTPDTVRVLRRHWAETVIAHPLDYVAARAELHRRQLGIGRAPVWVYHPEIDANPFGYSVRNPGANEAARDYVEGFADPRLDGRAPFYLLWAYLVVAVGAGIWLLVRARERRALVAVGALGLTAATLQVGLAVGAMTAQYRFQFPVVVVGLVVGIVGIAAHRRGGVTRSRPHTLTAAPAPAERANPPATLIER